MNAQGAKRFFAGLYRDLDDRHMLLPAIALLVAIVAVPMLLGGSSSEPPPPPPATPANADADVTAVQAAVLASEPGIRDYRKRLEALKEQNPFVQQFAGDGDDDQADAGTGAPVGPGATDPADGAAPATGGDIVSVPGSEGEAPTEATPEPEDTATVAATADEPTEPETIVQTRFYGPRVDVTFGELGEAERYEDVRHFDFLPSEKRPVVAFLGLADSADKAVFAVSNEVTETSGDGTCAPRGAAGCELLILQIGDQRMLKLGDGTTYRLRLLDTDFQRIPDPREEQESEGTSAGG